MGEKRSETYDQDLKDKQNAEIEADHVARRERLGHVVPSGDVEEASEEEN